MVERVTFSKVDNILTAIYISELTSSPDFMAKSGLFSPACKFEDTSI